MGTIDFYVTIKRCQTSKGKSQTQSVNVNWPLNMNEIFFILGLSFDFAGNSTDSKDVMGSYQVSIPKHKQEIINLQVT